MSGSIRLRFEGFLVEARIVFHRRWTKVSTDMNWLDRIAYGVLILMMAFVLLVAMSEPLAGAYHFLASIVSESNVSTP